MMKKWILAVLVLLILFIISSYAFIPSVINISSIIKVSRNTATINRSLDKPLDWSKWWPQKNTAAVTSIWQYNGLSYAFAGRYYNAMKIIIQSKTDRFESRIDLLPINHDSTFISWTYQIQTGLNPLDRLVNYRNAVSRQADLSQLLVLLRHFLQKDQNVYNIDVKQGLSKDSTLVVTGFTTSTAPTVNEIYHSITELKNYVSNQGAAEIDFPMLLIKKQEAGSYETMVAVPTNKPIPEKGKILSKRFVPWKIVFTEVKGGNSVITASLEEFNNYLSDNQIHQMAQPFESLVTNRSVETDSSKWITRIICPVP